MELVIATSAGLDDGTVSALRRLWATAFDGFSDDDADHAFGGVHVLLRDGSTVLAHASAVPRTIRVGEQAFATGYVEAVAALPGHQGCGLGTRVMRALEPELRRRWSFGVLATGAHGFYERLGWERWRGPSYVLTAQGPVRSLEEDDALMVLRFGPSRGADLSAAITCEDRPGDAW
ncbi:MAG TPA: GNAT family N-acetyltransferase [Nocardioides sp.]|uniref:GNAT family N-acetyltransferase n=1 Tax=Nocardioides sp. TaxID=35761 RepID=UPI002ED77D11